MSEEKKAAKEKFEWLKNMTFLKKLKQVKHIGLIVTIIFILILVIILFGDFNLFAKSSSTTSVSSNEITYTTSLEYEKAMEDKLKNLITKIKGTGNVDVMVMLESSASVVLALNDEKVTTTNGGVNTTTVSATPIILEQNGTKTPVVVAEILPKIKGVVVVSSGAENISVKLNIINAVQTLTGLSTTAIQVLIGK